MNRTSATGEIQTLGHITSGKDTLDIGLHVFVDENAVVCLDTTAVNKIHIWLDPDGDDNKRRVHGFAVV